MPDKRRHRGKHPDDDRLFAADQHKALRTAVGEHSWLLTRGYAPDSTLKLVGDRHNLTARQRMAVRRSSCSDQSLKRRRATMTTLKQSPGQTVGVDGYNLLITVESALSGGLILVGRDGCYRDLASIHGTYRKVEETLPAVEMIVDYLAALNIPHIDWYLDRPVSNSGRLKTLIAEVVAAHTRAEPDRAAGFSPRDASQAQRAVGCSDRHSPSFKGGQGGVPRRQAAGGLQSVGVRPAARGAWNIELVASPDAVLAASPNPVVTSDSAVLDRCGAWLNLAADLIDTRVPDAWKVDLRAEAGAA